MVTVVHDHAAARLLHRDPTADLPSAIRQAHAAALRLSARAITSDGKFTKKEVYLPASRGCFVCDVVFASEQSNDQMGILLHRKNMDQR